MVMPFVAMVLHDPGFNGMASLLNVNRPTRRVNAINSRPFKSLVIGDGPEGTGDFPWRDTYRLYVMFR
jgi:hypothetical protein